MQSNSIVNQKEYEVTQEDITRMAREAGFVGIDGEHGALRRFAAIVAAAEREACAKLCEAQENKVVRKYPGRIEFDPDSMKARKCAAVIRARSMK